MLRRHQLDRLRPPQRARRDVRQEGHVLGVAEERPRRRRDADGSGRRPPRHHRRLRQPQVRRSFPRRDDAEREESGRLSVALQEHHGRRDAGKRRREGAEGSGSRDSAGRREGHRRWSRGVVTGKASRDRGSGRVRRLVTRQPRRRLSHGDRPQQRHHERLRDPVPARGTAQRQDDGVVSLSLNLRQDIGRSGRFADGDTRRSWKDRDGIDVGEEGEQPRHRSRSDRVLPAKRRWRHQLPQLGVDVGEAGV